MEPDETPMPDVYEIDPLVVSAESPTPTPYAVHCHGVDPEVGAGPCEPWPNLVYMTHEFYLAQMADADYGWRCPRCFGPATFSDENYEDSLSQDPTTEITPKQ